MRRRIQMSEDEVLAHSISNVVDGWVLRDGRLHLEVMCSDGTRRYVTLDRDREDPTAALRFMDRMVELV